jgi:tetratricopeptide (TPR) repeat protein
LGQALLAIGLDHPNVASELNYLGLLYVAQGRYDEAEPLYMRALGIDEKRSVLTTRLCRSEQRIAKDRAIRAKQEALLLTTSKSSPSATCRKIS